MILRLFRKMNRLEGCVQKGDHKKDASHEVLHLQNFFNTIQGSDSKVKYDVKRSKRSADKSEKLVNYQTASSSMLFSKVVKESSFFSGQS